MTAKWTEQDELQIREMIRQRVSQFEEYDSGFAKINEERNKLWKENVIRSVIIEHFGRLIEELFDKLKRWFMR